MPMITFNIQKANKEMPSSLSEDDIEILKSFFLLVLQGDDAADMPLDMLLGYYSACKGLLFMDGDEQNDEMRDSLIE